MRYSFIRYSLVICACLLNHLHIFLLMSRKLRLSVRDPTDPYETAKCVIYPYKEVQITSVCASS